MKVLLSNIKEELFKEYNGYPSLWRISYDYIVRAYMYIWMYIWEYLHIDISLGK